MSKVCYYHGADFDGICSAAIVRYFAGKDIELIPVDYQDEIPVPTGLNQVFLVDFSFKPETMKVIRESNNEFIWIDHHKTAIESNDTKYLGVRDIGKAACELCWKYFANTPMPYGVELLGRYDVWDHKNKDVLPFQYGLRAYAEMLDPRDGGWSDMFAGNSFAFEIHGIGKLLLDYQDAQNKRACKVGARRIVFEGHRALICNTAIHGSRFYKGRRAKLFISYNQLADKRWKVSLYSESVDCGAIAKKHGGGGHTGAAGFTCTELPWV